MRKIAMLCLVLLVLLAGCAAPLQTGTNEIRPMELTEREKSLMELLGGGDTGDTEILLFEYDVSEPCTLFEAWVEVYEKGELVADWPAGLSMSNQEPRPWKGTLAITISKDPEFVWRFAAEEGSGRVSQRSQPLPVPEYTSISWGSILEPVTVEQGKEVILHSATYSTSDTTIVYSEEEYVDPAHINTQDYLQLIKCKFSSESPWPDPPSIPANN